MTNDSPPDAFWPWARAYLGFACKGLLRFRTWRASLFIFLNWRRLARQRVVSGQNPPTETLSPFTYTMH